MIGQQQAILIIVPSYPSLSLNAVSKVDPSSVTGPLLSSFVLAFGYPPGQAATSAGFPLSPLVLFAAWRVVRYMAKKAPMTTIK